MINYSQVFRVEDFRSAISVSQEQIPDLGGKLRMDYIMDIILCAIRAYLRLLEPLSMDKMPRTLI